MKTNKEIKATLKAAFPTVKFYVTGCYIKWTDGCSQAQVEAIVGKTHRIIRDFTNAFAEPTVKEVCELHGATYHMAVGGYRFFIDQHPNKWGIETAINRRLREIGI